MKRGRLVLAAAIVAALAGTTGAQPSPADAVMAKMVAALDSNDYQTRQSASEQLAKGELITLEMIEQALSAGVSASGKPLSPEQRQRLLQAGMVRFEQTPRAAMGVQFDQMGPLRDRIVIEKAMEEFPSFKLLQEGDIIDAVSGQRLRGGGARTMLRSLIISREPGDVLEVEVLRGAERVALKIPLGKFADLKNGAGLDPLSLLRAWKVRSAGYGSVSVEPVRAAMTAEEWRDADTMVRQRQMNATAPRTQVQATMAPGRSAVVTGSRPRALVSDDGALAKANSMRDEMILDAARGGVIRAGMVFDDLESASGRQMTNEDEVKDLEQLIDSMKKQMAKAAGEVDIGGMRGNGKPMSAESYYERQVRRAEKLLSAVKSDGNGK